MSDLNNNLATIINHQQLQQSTRNIENYVKIIDVLQTSGHTNFCNMTAVMVVRDFLKKQ